MKFISIKYVIFFALVGLLLSSSAADAYIDPGTIGSGFNMLPFIFGSVIFVLGFLFRPMKRTLGSVVRLLRQKPKSARRQISNNRNSRNEG